MSEMKPTPDTNGRGAPRLLAGLLGLVLLLAAASYGGYTFGSANVPPTATPAPTMTPVVRVEQTEVTREVMVVVTATPEPTPVEMARPDDVPQPAETAVPEELSSEANGPSTLASPGTYDEVWSIIEQEFDGDLPSEQDRVYGAIVGSLDALDDDYTRFLRPEIAERMRDDLDGSVSGIGAIVRETDDGLVEIVRPMDGQPADTAGILPGDIVVAVDGESVLDKGFDEVLLLIRGPEGTSVTLSLAREGETEPLEIEVVRATFDIAVVESEMLGEEGQQIAYVRLTSFTRAAESGILEALRPLLAEEPVGIILDLRDNGGGFLDQAVSVADIFLPQSVVLRERSENGLDETFNADGGDIGEELPLVVLVNAGSASASEIVAGAIQDNQRGILVGETTFGKGSVQHVHTLGDGSELRVTIARWYTPDGRSISEDGIDPDIEVATPPDLGGDTDEQLQAAIDYLLGGN